ncbi:MAG: hypothetical protein FWH40_10145 [Coriobacteriia bacterium]|nr:hypothetical protein [Coriobacteriia bacterium]
MEPTIAIVGLLTALLGLAIAALRFVHKTQSGSNKKKDRQLEPAIKSLKRFCVLPTSGNRRHQLFYHTNHSLHGLF